jgi:hypothetical protein
VFKKREKVNMSDLNEKLAQEAAELINGGEWHDGKWYSDGQRDAWRRALQPAADRIEKLEAALREIVGALEDPKGGQHVYDMRNASYIARKALEGKDD